MFWFLGELIVEFSSRVFPPTARPERVGGSPNLHLALTLQRGRGPGVYGHYTVQDDDHRPRNLVWLAIAKALAHALPLVYAWWSAPLPMRYDVRCLSSLWLS